MARRILYRLLIIIPVTLSILLITLFLFYQLPGTRVLDSNQIEIGSDRELEQLIWLQEDRQLFHNARGLFYIGIHRGFVPDSLYLIPVVFRASVKQLSKEVRNKDEMNAWINWAHNEMTAMKQGRSTLITSRDLFHILRATSVTELSKTVTALDIHAEQYPAVWERILKSDDAKNQSILRFQWNGSNNLFHYYLKSILTGSPVLYTLSGDSVRAKFYRTLRWTLAYTIPALAVGSVAVFFFVLWFHDRLPLLTWVDRGSVLFYSFPTFVLATLALVFLTSHRYGVLSTMFPFPVFIDSGADSFMDIYGQYGNRLILPMLLFAINPMILLYRVFYQKIHEIKKTQPSYRYLRHLGISAFKFRFRYVSRYLIVSACAILSNLFVAVLGGSLIIEWIFNIPGLGRFLYESIVNYDIVSTVYLIFVFTVVQQMGHLFSDFLIDYFYAPVSGSNPAL